jgi:hypothetical protein
MFNWLLEKIMFWKKKEEGTNDNLYYPKERLIYKYYNGHRVVEADPLVLYKKHRQVWPDLCTDIKIATSAMLSDKETIPAHNKIVEQIRWIFDLVPIESGGLTEPEAEDLYEHFLDYCDRIKKNSSPSQISSMPSEEQTVSSPVVQPTNNSSDSGSIAGESAIGAQEQLLSESVSPPAQ